MDKIDLDRLEQLTRLRAAGSLTDLEFQEQKQELYGSSQRGGGRIIVVLTCLLLVTGIAGAIAWANRAKVPEVTPQKALVKQAVTAPVQFAPSPLASPADRGTDLLNFATSNEVLGMNPAFLEKRLGVPREKRGDMIVFELAGCTITYWHFAGQITNFTLDFTRSCAARIRGDLVSSDTTFGQLQAQANGPEFSTCLEGCGNAVSPSIWLRFPGFRANNGITVFYSSDGDRVDAVRQSWHDALVARVGDPIENIEQFICAKNPPPVVRKQLFGVRVTSVLVTNEDTESC